MAKSDDLKRFSGLDQYIKLTAANINNVWQEFIPNFQLVRKRAAESCGSLELLLMETSLSPIVSDSKIYFPRYVVATDVSSHEINTLRNLLLMSQKNALTLFEAIEGHLNEHADTYYHILKNIDIQMPFAQPIEEEDIIIYFIREGNSGYEGRMSDYLARKTMVKTIMFDIKNSRSLVTCNSHLIKKLKFIIYHEKHKNLYFLFPPTDLISDNDYLKAAFHRIACKRGHNDDLPNREYTNVKEYFKKIRSVMEIPAEQLIVGNYMAGIIEKKCALLYVPPKSSSVVH